MSPAEILRAMEAGRLYINPFCNEESSDLLWKGTSYTGVPSYGLLGFGYTFRLSWGDSIWILSREKEHGGLVTGQSYFEVEVDPWVMDSPYVMLPPYSVAKCSSLEDFILPEDWVGFVFNIGHYVSLGVSLLCAPLPPQHNGSISFSLVNHTPKPVNLVLGAGVGSVVFFEVGKRSDDFSFLVEEMMGLYEPSSQYDR